jgi:outer membrane lipoprotein SlyB
MRGRFALVLALGLALTGCGGEPTPSGTSPAGRPSSTATLAIVEPADDAVVRGDTVEVVFSLEGGTLVDLTETAVRPDEGHLHVTVDGALVSMTGGLEQELTGLEPGPHLLKAEYVAADHAPFQPRVLAAVAFTVEER